MEYTLPGVMQFLRSEWERREQTHIEWELERADLLSRLGRLDSENHGLRRELNEARRHLEILGRKTTENLDATTLEASQSTADDLLETVKDSKAYLRQCVADIKHVLQQHKIETGALVDFHSPEAKVLTIANFGSSASSVVLLPNNRVAAGTARGEVIVWQLDWESMEISVPEIVDNIGDSVTSMAFSAPLQRLVVSAANEIRVYSPGFRAVATSSTDEHKCIIEVKFSPHGNLVVAVLSDGSVNVWSLQKDELQLMCAPAFGVSASCFAEMDDDMHLVLACSDSPESREGSLVLADPLTGESLKKIVFSSQGIITSLAVTKTNIIMGTDAGDLRVVSLAGGETLAEAPSAHRGEITSLSATESEVVSTSVDGRASLWELPALTWKGRMFSHDSAYGALASCVGERASVVSGGDEIIRVYERQRPEHAMNGASSAH